MESTSNNDEKPPELNSAQDVGFCAFFNALAAQRVDTIRTFDRGGFYSVHGAQDTGLVCRYVYQTTSVIKYLGSPGSNAVASVTMSRAVFAKFLKICLFELGLCIELWEMSKEEKQWRCVKKASPGNVLAISDLIPSADLESAVLLSIQCFVVEGKKSVACCYANADKNEIGLLEFEDNETFSNTESLVIQLGIKECLLPRRTAGRDVDISALEAVMSRCSVFVNEGSFTKTGTDILRLLNDKASLHNLPILEKRAAVQCSNAVIEYLRLLEQSDNQGNWTLADFSLSQYMKLDASAVRALSVLPSSYTGGNNKSMSLFGLLNRCKTPLGSRLLSQWLRQPLMHLKDIETRHELVGFFTRQDLVAASIRDELKLVPDLTRLARKFRRQAATLEDVVRSYQVATRLPHVISAFSLENLEESDLALVTGEYITPLSECDAFLSKLQDLVETTIDLEALSRHEFLIRYDFDANLGEIRAKIDAVMHDIEAQHLKVALDLNSDPEKKLKLENHTTFGFCFRLSRAEASLIRNKSGFRELQTAKAGVYFTNSSMSSLSSSYTDLSTRYTRHQSALVREVVQIAASYAPILERLGQHLAHLDVILSFAAVSDHAPIPYIKPTMHARGTGNVVLVESRHPCLEAQDDVRFIPNDVSLMRGQSEFLIITGPNMGGKSTYIRQVGVVALLAQIGCFVPCQTAELTVFDSILARVGAGDSQLKGVSTFMAEMLETGAIMRTATRDSLVIIDELGRGTSTTDGFGLAYSISEHLVREIGCFTLFATHFHELTTLSETETVVKNLHVAAHLDHTASAVGVTLLYKVVEGSSNKSFGIHVAEMARFPASVVAMAKRKLEELEDDPSHAANSESEQQMARRSRLVLAKIGALSHNTYDSKEDLLCKFQDCMAATPDLVT